MRMLVSKWKSGCRMQVRVREAAPRDPHMGLQTSRQWLHIVTWADSNMCETSGLLHVICVGTQCCRSSL